MKRHQLSGRKVVRWRSRFIPAFFCLAATVVTAEVSWSADKIDTTASSSLGSGQKDIRSRSVDSDYACGKVDKAGSRLNKKYLANPPHAERPVNVEVIMQIVLISKIDAVRNNFNFEAFKNLLWCDPRLAFDSDRAGIGRHVFSGAAAARKLEAIWSPDAVYIKEVGRRVTENEEAIIYADGTVEHKERFGALMQAEFDVTQFPFDRQKLQVEFESFPWPAENLIFRGETIADGSEKPLVGFSNSFEIAEWEIESIDTKKIVARKTIRDQRPFSSVVVEINVKRNPGFYIWRIILPLMLIVVASWIVFWIPPGENSRISVSFSAMFVIVAFNFMISQQIPKVSTVTYIDAMIILSFGFIFLSIIQDLIVMVLNRNNRTGPAQNCDLVCRIGFPAAYLAGNGILVVGYFPPALG